LPLGLAFVNELRPVSWTWNSNERNSESIVGTKQAGFIAQDIVALQKENDASYLGFGSDINPDEFTVGMSAAIPVLVNAIKELSAELTTLKAEVAALKQQA